MQVGDAVEHSPDEEQDVFVIGEVTAIEGDQVTFVESHAFHRIWGGSNASRGDELTVASDVINPVRRGWAHIVREWPASRSLGWKEKHGKEVKSHGEDIPKEADRP